jgi:hypothetical protein
VKLASNKMAEGEKRRFFLACADGNPLNTFRGRETHVVVFSLPG